MSELDVDKLKALRARLRSRKKAGTTVTVHMGTCGIASGAREVLDAVLEAAKDMGQSGVEIRTSGCAGLCSREPMLTVETCGRPPVKYCGLDATKARRVYSEHVVGGTPVSEYALGAGCETMY